MENTQTKIYNIPLGIPFVDCLVKGIIECYGSTPEIIAKTTLFVPNTQNVAPLRDAFFRHTKGKILLLPKIRVLGVLDEIEKLNLINHANSQFQSLHTHKPIPNALRIPALAKLILNNPAVCRAVSDYQTALSVARNILDLLDLLYQNQKTPKDLLSLNPKDYNHHWQKTIDMVLPVNELWQNFLTDTHYMDTLKFKSLMYAYMADYWTQNPTNNPVIACGIHSNDKIILPFLQTIRDLPNGQIILCGLESDLSQKGISYLSHGHPQKALYDLLTDLNVHQSDIMPWHQSHNFIPQHHGLRTQFASEMMRPSATTEEWNTINNRLSEQDIIHATRALKIIGNPNDRTEATAIALVIREALEKPHQKIALVTQSTELISRVCSVLGRWDIKPTNPASVPLMETPQGIYIGLLCHLLQDNFSPLSVLALLKNPLTTAGLPFGEFKKQVLLFEKYIIRGNIINNGLLSYQKYLNAFAEKLNKNPENHAKYLEIYQKLSEFFTYLTGQFSDILGLSHTITVSEFIPLFKNLLVELTCIDSPPNTTQGLFGTEAGMKILEALDMLYDNSDIIGTIPQMQIYTHILNSMNAVFVLAVDYNTNKNIEIWNIADLCFKQADILIIAGLTEGVFPVSPKTGVWLSRDMRKSLGLAEPEAQIGADAFYFTSGFCQKQVCLSYSHESNGSPTIPSRWIIRLENLLKGAVKNPQTLNHIYDTPYISWAGILDTMDTKPKPAKRPEPKPPVSVRPTSISVTDAEKWIRDPYAIYCKHILNLRKLPEINQDFEASQKGDIIHNLLHHFTLATADGFGGNPHQIMNDLVTQVFDTIKQSPILYIFWKEKLRSESLQFVDFEIDRRKNLKPILYEHNGIFSFATSNGGTFTLKARCDRIDTDKNGQAILVDYKTSSASAPSYEQMKAGFAPQLPLQAIMLSQGGFGKPYTVAGAEYIIINKAIETKAMRPKEKMNDDPVFCDLMGDIFKQFQTWVDLFNDDNTGYISRRLPEFLKFTGDYDLLARVPEWNIADDDSGEQDGE